LKKKKEGAIASSTKTKGAGIVCHLSQLVMEVRIALTAEATLQVREAARFGIHVTLDSIPQN
jgi:hypothetical protein